jgi:hypothetical protein
LSYFFKVTVEISVEVTDSALDDCALISEPGAGKYVSTVLLDFIVVFSPLGFSNTEKSTAFVEMTLMLLPN